MNHLLGLLSPLTGRRPHHYTPCSLLPSSSFFSILVNPLLLPDFELRPTFAPSCISPSSHNVCCVSTGVCCMSISLSVLVRAVTVSYLKCYVTKVSVRVPILRSHSMTTCTSPSNYGSTVAGSLFDGQLGDSLLDSFTASPGQAGQCPPMQVQGFFFSRWLQKNKCVIRLHRCFQL